VILGVVSVAVAVAAPALVRVLAPGLEDPDLAVRCTRFTAVTVLAFGVAGYLGAALRSTHAFGSAAAIYVAYNVGIVALMLGTRDTWGVVGAAAGIAV